ncbi:MAG TPA: hypothetical protein VNR87_04530 [Flavisolibacter sp.]|nr:hypothetical protein [Flavisolibacter sp.]
MRILLYLLPVCYFMHANYGSENPAQPYSYSFKTYRTVPAIRFFRLGDQLITLEKYARPEAASYVLVSLHSNELAAIRTAMNFAEARNAVFYRLMNSERRNVEADLLDKKITFDPNCIFTTTGRKQNLKMNHCFDKPIDEQVFQLSRFIIRDMSNEKAIVSVHSSDDHSILEYKKGGALHKQAKEICQQPSMDAGDFMVTNEEYIYRALKSKGFNVVLQNKAKAKDDGSLGIFCSRAGKPYVGIETRAGHTEEELRMLDAVDRIFE